MHAVPVSAVLADGEVWARACVCVCVCAVPVRGSPNLPALPQLR